MNQKPRESRRFETLTSKGELVELIEDIVPGRKVAYGKMIIRTQNHNLYQSGLFYVQDDIKKKQRELEEKKRREEERRLLEDEMRRLNEARKLYQSEKDRLNQLNEELSLIEEKKSKRFLYDDDVSIVKNTETKTFHSNYIQKKHKIKEEEFPKRTTETRILGSECNNDTVYVQNASVNPQYIQQVEEACPTCGRYFVNNNLCPDCQKETNVDMNNNKVEYQQECLCQECAMATNENNNLCPDCCNQNTKQ